MSNVLELKPDPNETLKFLKEQLFFANKEIERLKRDNGALRKMRDNDALLISWQNERIQQWIRVVDAAEAYTRRPDMFTASELRVATKAWRNTDNAKDRDAGKRAFARDAAEARQIGHNSGDDFRKAYYGE